jgi:hypothetical protein
VVLVTARRQLRTSMAQTDVALRALQAAVEQLPQPEDPLVDRLFALECIHRAGEPGRNAAARLETSRRDAEWQIEHDWKPDVPHLAVLGQVISTIRSSGDDPPSAWGPRLAQAVAELANRPARFGIGSDPVLLAAVVRGMGVLKLPLPPAVIETVQRSLEVPPSPAAIVELTEALAHQTANRQLLQQAAGIAFRDMDGDAEAAVARWWLAQRWEELRGETPPVKPADIEAARTRSLALPHLVYGRSAAMLAEAAGRSVANLVIASPELLGRLSQREQRRASLENYGWRTAAVVTACAILLSNLRGLVNALARQFGLAPPTPEALRLAVAAVVGIAVATQVGILKAGYNRFVGKEPYLIKWTEFAIPLISAFLAALFYR